MKQELTEEIRIDNMRRVVAGERVEDIVTGLQVAPKVRSFLKDLDERVQLECLNRATLTETIDEEKLTVTLEFRRIEDPDEQTEIINRSNASSYIN